MNHKLINQKNKSIIKIQFIILMDHKYIKIIINNYFKFYSIDIFMLHD